MQLLPFKELVEVYNKPGKINAKLYWDSNEKAGNIVVSKLHNDLILEIQTPIKYEEIEKLDPVDALKIIKNMIFALDLKN